MATADKKKKTPLTIADVIDPKDAEALQVLMDMARQALKGGPVKKSSVTDLADAVNTQFRGAQGIASRLYLEFQNTATGSPQRAQILRDVVRLQLEAGKGNTQTSVDDLEEDEIDEAILSILQGDKEQDPGDPQTPEGKALSETILLDDGIDDDEMDLRAEIQRLEEAEEVDVIAKRITKRTRHPEPEPADETDEVE